MSLSEQSGFNGIRYRMPAPPGRQQAGVTVYLLKPLTIASRVKLTGDMLSNSEVRGMGVGHADLL